jgi:hypothetical protein
MAITIEQSPHSTTPAYEDIIYVISSTNSGNTNFKYVIDIVVNGTSNRITVFPHPSYGTAYVNIGKIIETYISSDIGDTINGFQECKGSFEDFTVQFGEQYGDPVVVYDNLTSTTGTAWNGIVDFLPFSTYSSTGYLEYVMSTNAASDYLTEQTSNVVIRDSEDAWLYGLTDTSGVIGYAEVITKDSAGSMIQTVNVQNHFTNIDLNDSKMVRLSTGTNNINNIPSSGISLGAQPIITASVASYDIKWYNLSSVAVSPTQTYTISNTCTRNNLYRFHFLNKKGGFDSFTFYRADSKSVRIQRDSYKKGADSFSNSTTYGYGTGARTNIAYNTKLTDTITVLSDWIDEETSTWLEQLISSPEVYLVDATYGLVAINISNSSYDFKQEETQKLFNLRINFTYSYNRFRQRY